MRVLVVSSDPGIRLRAGAALRARDGFEVDEATSAMDGHLLTSERDYDVLVIDGDMRPEGGQSLLFEIRARAEYEGVAAPPALMLMGREVDRWVSKWAGAADAVVKPVDSFDIARRVLALVGEVEFPEASGRWGPGKARDMDTPPALDHPDAPSSELAP
ncbi:MAG: hypothetical protein KY462_02140 [Actinobacteria bacterium]|nr:hypothetical protein [Actinomycetota bacterium]